MRLGGNADLLEPFPAKPKGISLIILLLTMVVCLCALPPGAAEAESTGAPQRPGVAVLDFNYIDTSGETNSRTAEHQLSRPSGLRPRSIRPNRWRYAVVDHR
jgi:hypothetical protein